MTTSRYIVSGVNATHGSFVDLGIARSASVKADSAAAAVQEALQDGKRDIIYHGGAASKEQVYLRAGVNLDFASKVGTGERVLYLDGNLADYTRDTSTAGRLVLTRAATGESLTLLVNATTKLVFANGSTTSTALNGSATPTLGADRSVDLNPQKIAGTAQTVRVINYASADDSDGEVMAIARTGTVYNVSGNTHVDTLYVEWGAKVNASVLGAGKDRIYFAGAWVNYTKTVVGQTVRFTDALGGYVLLSMSQGANQDELVFTDGLVNGLNVLDELRQDASVAFADIVDNNTLISTGLYTPPALGQANLVLTDTGTSASDNITNDGTMTVTRGAGELTDKLEYRIKGDNGQWGTWVAADLNLGEFTLAAQASGVYGKAYEAGSIEMRQVSGARSAGESVLNANKIVVDNAIGNLSVDTTVLDVVLAARSNGTGSALNQTYSTRENTTIAFWVKDLSEGENLIFINNVSNTGVGSAFTLNASADGLRGSWNFTTNSSASVLGSEWKHVAIVSTAQGFIAYVGGVNIGSTGSNLARTFTSSFAIGANSSSYVSTASMNVRELVVYSRALSAAEVGNLVSGTVPSSSLQGHYSLDVNLLNKVSGGLALQGSSTFNANTSDSKTPAFLKTKHLSINPYLDGAGAEYGAELIVTAEIIGSNGAVTSTFAVNGSQNISADGSWSFTPTNLNPQQETNYRISIQQKDKAGNQSDIKTIQAFIGNSLIPSTPNLENASDLGVSNSDNLTADSTPTFSGTFRANSSDFVLSVEVNGVATRLSTNGTGGLVFSLSNGTWSYTPLTPYADGTNLQVKVIVAGAESNYLPVTVDSTAANTTLAEPAAMPAILQASSFTDGVLKLSGTAEAGSTAVKLIFTDKDNTTVSIDATVVTSANGLTTTWSADLTPAQLASLDEGSGRLAVEATSLSGATGVLQANPTFMLELVNTAPVANNAVSTINAFASTGLVVDLQDVFADPSNAEAYFLDTDLLGSNNGTLTYTAQLSTDAGGDGQFGTADDTYTDLPTWLTISADGKVSVADGQNPVAGAHHLRVTVTDGAGANASRHLEVSVSDGPVISLDAALVGKDLDLRSDLILKSSSPVSLVAEADGNGKTITLVNLDDADRSIVLNMGNAADRAKVTIEGDTIRINPAMDLDLGAKYRLELTTGVFVDGQDKQSQGVGPLQSVQVSAVGTKLAGVASVGHLYDDAGLLQAVNWYDLTDRGSMGIDAKGWVSERAAALDAGTGANVFYGGAAVLDGATVTTVLDFWSTINNFGADDFIYLDDKRTKADGYGSADVVASIGRGTVTDLNGAPDVDGNNLFITAGGIDNAGARIDLGYDATTKASLPGGFFESWDDQARSPSYTGVFGHLPVLVA